MDRWAKSWEGLAKSKKSAGRKARHSQGPRALVESGLGAPGSSPRDEETLILNEPPEPRSLIQYSTIYWALTG